MKDKRTKMAFIEFLGKKENHSLRFWQALLNFACNYLDQGIFVKAIVFEHHGSKVNKDTYYIESDKYLRVPK